MKNAVFQFDYAKPHPNLFRDRKRKENGISDNQLKSAKAFIINAFADNSALICE